MASGTIGKDAGGDTTNGFDASDEPDMVHSVVAQLTRLQVAEYIAELTEELAKMARRSELETVGYLLDIVKLEADSTVRHLASLANLG